MLLPISTVTEPPIRSYERISVDGGVVAVGVGVVVVVVGVGGCVVVVLASGTMVVDVAVVLVVGVVVVGGTVVAGADPVSVVEVGGLARGVATAVVGIMAGASP